jgi:thioredoxin-like negative regulator of GroEL
LYNDLIRPYKRFILYTFLIAVFSVATYFAYVSIIQPRLSFYENFGADVANDNNRQDQATIMGFFADWCPHCTKAKPEWATFTSPMANGAVPYGKYLLQAVQVDCTDGNDPRIQKYSVNGYPTVIIIKDGQTIRFEGPVKADNLKSFVTDTLGKAK